MEDGSLPTGAGIIDDCAGIDVGPTVEEQGGRPEVAEFRGHMQERSPLNREAAPAAHAAIEFRKTPVDECGIGVDLLSQAIQPAAEQCQHTGCVVPRLATRLEKEIDAVIPLNPAHSVRGPKYSVKKGKTSVLSAGEMRQLLDSIDISSLIGLRDRALVALMGYTFARVGAVTQMKVEDYYIQKRRGWVRLHEKGGKHASDHPLPRRLRRARPGFRSARSSPLCPHGPA